MESNKNTTFKKDYFEYVLFIIMTPLYSGITPWISIPMAFFQDIVILILIMAWSDSSSATTSVRVPLSGGGILGALLSVAVFGSLLQIVHDHLLIAILVIVSFYIYALITNKLPRFKWMNDPKQKQ